MANRIGIVATANAITALQMTGGSIPHAEAIVRTLVSRRRQDGAWSYISNLNDVGVVDSTVSVLLALYPWQDAVEFRSMDLPMILRGSLDWLEQVALGEGGWGIIAGTTYRNYSTALAVQVLSHSGRRGAQVVQRAVHRLVSLADPETGAWHDASRHLSVPTTSEVVRALCAAANEHAKYSAEIAKACNWILNVARPTRLWDAGATTSLEEVEVATATGLTRIEYGHSPRAVAICALSTAGRASTPEAVAATRILLEDIAKSRWDAVAGGRYAEPMSWMLYDITTAIVTFRTAFARNTVAVWTDNVRVVEHQHGQGVLTRMLKQHWRKLAIAGGCILVAWMLVKAGMVPNVGYAMLLFIISTIALNVSANSVSELLKNRKRKNLFGDS